MMLVGDAFRLLVKGKLPSNTMYYTMDDKRRVLATGSKETHLHCPLGNTTY